MKILFNQRQKLATTEPVGSLPTISGYGQDGQIFSIVDKTPSDRELILEHPAKSNRHHDEYRFCHPRNPRGPKNGRASFIEIQTTLNDWTPDDVPEKASSDEEVLDSLNSKNILRKCVVKGVEKIDDMILITAFKQRGPHLNKIDPKTYCYKVAMYDTKKKVFLLRTAGKKAGVRLIGYIDKIDVHSFNPKWYVDQSTPLAHKDFWLRLKEIVNSS